MFMMESKKIKRVVKSTLAAEAMSLGDAIDTAEYIGCIFSEMVLGQCKNMLPIECFVDNRSLVENLHSTKSVTEKRLRIDLASIKENVKNGSVLVKWIQSDQQISDCLTKRGANPHRLQQVISQGYLLKY